MAMQAWTDAQVEAALERLPGFSYREGRLHVTYRFSNFREAISFITRVAFEAEERNHHPELRNVYHTVEIGLTTHDAGNRVTDADVALAEAIAKLVWVDPV